MIRTVIHHLNCATLCPRAAPRLGLVDRDPGDLVARCVLFEDACGLVLIDTGFGTRDVVTPARLGPARFLLAPRMTPAQTAVAQIRALWLLHAGDAYLQQGEIASPRRSTAALNAYHALNSADSAHRRDNAERLAALTRDHHEDVTVFCSHDPAEFRRDTARPVAHG